MKEITSITIVFLFLSGLMQIAFIFYGLAIAIIPLVSISVAIVLLVKTLS